MLEDVIWIERVNVTVSGTTLKKTGGCDGCLDAGASSQQHLPAGNGYLEFTISETDKVRYIGLNTSSTTPYPQDILFGLKQVSGRAEVKEAGKYRADIAVTTGDVMRIAVHSGVITYAKNGTVFYTSETTENNPMYADSALINLGATLTNARMTVAADDASSGSGSRSLSASKSTGGGTENVSWTDLVNVTSSANSLQKTGGCDGCQDAGALSQQFVSSGDAYLDFIVSETGPMLYIGLNDSNVGTSGAEIPFAIKLLNNYAEVREHDQYRANIEIGSGDMLRIAVQAGVVSYAKNGTVFYSSDNAVSYPLRIDTSFISSGSTLSNARITGFSSK